MKNRYPSDIDHALAAIRDEERRRVQGLLVHLRSGRWPKPVLLSDREKLELLVEIQNGQVR